jgi:hypothetical protein
VVMLCYFTDIAEVPVGAIALSEEFAIATS